MSDLDATTPRVFLARHGETEWTKNGRYTGTTDLALTPYGITQVAGTARQLVGSGKLIDPANVAHVYVSPRLRARQTFDLLFSSNARAAGDAAAGGVPPLATEKVTVTEDIAEWDYGDYEGLLVGEIRARRKERGMDGERPWNIWRDGCEGGESAEQVTDRLDKMIAKIREIQEPCINNGGKPADVVLVAHGLILRAFVKRWLRYPLDDPLPMMFSPGAIGVLSYKNHNVDEPGFYVGMALPMTELD
ncbi:hypothetical protein Dda_7142 [Drechslerella dactyloides]|uniref:Phosphoglycerate mutase n=1 Tax=Drechslerella dactyloides TaxID=74499 RepID=A0AAD6ITH6_DREDA|nr:hypothetical protein Dda_7142 [Drechslerella dactyloides]